MDTIEEICKNSYRNFHCRGMDYLCIQRSENLTRKVYFMDGDLSGLPEIVVPHNHRYNFKTKVLVGEMDDQTYVAGQGDVYNKFSFMTPLNGGNGFTWVAEQRLKRNEPTRLKTGDTHFSPSYAIHTLKIRSPQTVIILDQYADLLPLDTPTQAWKLEGGKEPPNLDGLYDEMTPDHARKLLGIYEGLV